MTPTQDKGSAEDGPQAFIGLDLAEIVDVNDPQGLHRVRISIPALGGSASEWARVAIPADTMLQPGQIVAVGFVGGDAAYPIVLGALRTR